MPHTKTVLAVALAGLIAATVTGCTPSPRHTVQVPACQYEEQDGPCFWDAKTSGNGQGVSFFVDANNNVYYTDNN